MYLLEWRLWKDRIEPHINKCKKNTAHECAKSTEKLEIYEEGLDEAIHFNSVSEQPFVRGPIYAFNDTYMEMRCGGSEEKRGIITLLTLGGLCPLTIFWLEITYTLVTISINRLPDFSILTFLLTAFVLNTGFAIIYFYAKYGLQLTRLEILTSRHLLIRFNRITQHVHLHRPSYCGGIVTFPWRSTASTSTDSTEDFSGLGTRLGLLWHPRKTGLPYAEIAFIGKQGQGGSELRDEWEFIRRYMEDGPQSVPRPRLSTQFPSPIQGFSAQFEGIGRFFRTSGWLMKLALLMIWPAFVIMGTAHWVSLMLCWRPRWPKIIREAGRPGKSIPPITTLSDYPSGIQERLLDNADRYGLKPGKRPEKNPLCVRTTHQVREGIT